MPPPGSRPFRPSNTTADKYCVFGARLCSSFLLRGVEVIDLTDDTPPKSRAAAETTQRPEPSPAARLARDHSSGVARASSSVRPSSSAPTNHHPSMLSSHRPAAAAVSSPSQQPQAAAAGGFLLEPSFHRLAAFEPSTTRLQPPANNPRPTEVIEVEQDYECDDSVIAAWMNGQVSGGPLCDLSLLPP